MKEIVRGQHVLGNYHLHAKYSCLICTQPVPVQKAYSPEEIVARIKGDFQENEMDNKENTDATLSTELSEAFLSLRERELVG